MDQGRPPEPRRPVVRQSGQVLRGALAGDVRLRVARPEQQEITVRRKIVRPRTWNPALVFVYGFASVIAIGTVLLMLPFVTASGEGTRFIDALFIATSAVCVTGLVVLDTGTHWNFAGQAIVAALIQIGGFGFMTSSTLLLALLGRAGLRERVLLAEALGGGSLGSVFQLLRRLAIFTIVMEVAGAVILTLAAARYLEGPLALWWGVFHAISAFNNAGFDVVGGHRSMIPYQTDPIIVLTIPALFIVGGISYVVVADLLATRRWSRLLVDTKLVLVTTGALIVLGTLALLFVERDNAATIGAMDGGTRVTNAFFQAVTPRTAGFSTIDIGKVTDAGLIVIIGLMFVGASAGSTGGGIKVQTFSLLFFAITSAVRGSTEVEAFRRRIPLPAIMRAIAVALLSLATVFATALVLTVTDHFAFQAILFESFSAFGTVGLSTGITPELSDPGRTLIIVVMFIGRLGPLTLVVALAARQRARSYRLPEAPVRIG